MRILSSSEVLRYFIFLELGITEQDNRNLQEIVQNLCFRDGQVNPFGVWTQGYQTDRRNEQITEWVETVLPARELYTVAVDPIWNPFLKKWKGNLRDVSACDLINRGLRGSIHPEKRKIAVIRRCPEQFNGEFEVIDGFHRSIRMLSEGTEKVEAIVGLTEMTVL